jgi:polyferredoxin
VDRLFLVAYFAPAGQLASNLWQGQAGPWEVFWILFYAAFTYLLAALLREKVCSHMCPMPAFRVRCSTVTR